VIEEEKAVVEVVVVPVVASAVAEEKVKRAVLAPRVVIVLEEEVAEERVERDLAQLVLALMKVRREEETVVAATEDLEVDVVALNSLLMPREELTLDLFVAMVKFSEDLAVGSAVREEKDLEVDVADSAVVREEMTSEVAAAASEVVTLLDPMTDTTLREVVKEEEVLVPVPPEVLLPSEKLCQIRKFDF
jgi:hypothetical protein